MQRDMDLARDLLLKVEEAPAHIHGQELFRHWPDRTVGELNYHVELLFQAGLIAGDGHLVLSTRNAGWRSLRLTYAGHEFLGTIRDPEIWRAAKSGASAAKGFSLDLLGALAKGPIKKQIEKHTGLELDL